MPSDDQTRLPEDSNRSNLLVDGQSFGQYKVVRLLGRGGMGEVYEVEHPVIRKRYALKLVNDEIMSRPDAVQRFQREAQVMANLEHPNIVKVDDFGETDGRTWLRMELIKGGLSAEALRAKEGDLKPEANSLADLLKGEPLPEALVVDLLKQILGGLAYAHAQGVVHRDLKPSNILLQSPKKLSVNFPSAIARRATVEAQFSGKKFTSKITDFGLVRLAGEQWVQSQVELTVARSMADPDKTRLEGEKSGSSTGTSSQALLGTFEFMSPEQKKGQDADAPSDLYSVGLMAFRMLTGQDVLGFEMPSELVPGLSAEWDPWIKLALAPMVERRFESAEAMLAAMPGGGGLIEEAPEIQSSPEPEPEPEPEPQPVGTVASDAEEDYEREAELDEQGVPQVEELRKQSSKKSKLLWGLLSLGLLLVGVFGWHNFSFSSSSAGQLSKERATQNEGSISSTSVNRSDRNLDLGGGERMKLKWIAPGSFQMGSNDGDSDEKPVHRVTLSKGYWLGEHEVTQGEWQAVMGSNPSHFKGSNLPVEKVSWEDAMSFCRKLTERERSAGRLAAGYSYTLPTEAQWEYACRAGTSGAYAGDLDAMAWYDKNSGSKTHPVGTKRANAWGLYDMHGNVWEWCSDWYGSYPSGNVVDPSGANSGSNRVSRGGSWYDTARGCRSADRFRLDLGIRFDNLGFRLALSSVQ